MIDTSSGQRVIRLGTRGSRLARMQSQWVAHQIERRQPAVKVQLVVCRTTGDAIVDRPLHELGGKGLFTKELELALLDGSVDLVVHSMKDVPVTMPLVDVSALVIAAVPWRADVRDVLVTRDGRSLRQLNHGATVATGSLRRRCQLLDLRPDLVVRPLRGNIDTRLRHVAGDTAGAGLGAVVLAAAGLRRAALYEPGTMSLIPTDDLLPAAAQGALALQCRADDVGTRRVAAVLDDPVTRMCVGLERDVVRELGGDCQSPIAALAEVEDGGAVRLRAAVGCCRGDGPDVVRAGARAPMKHAHDALATVLRELEERHAHELLAGAASAAA